MNNKSQQVQWHFIVPVLLGFVAVILCARFTVGFADSKEVSSLDQMILSKGITAGVDGVATDTAILEEEKGETTRMLSPTCRKSKYRIEYYAPKETEVSKGIRDAIDKAFCAWSKEKPLYDTFYITSMRMERNYGYVSVTYDTEERAARRKKSEEEVVAETTSMIYAYLDGEWKAAVITDSNYLTIINEIPETALSKAVKRNLVEVTEASLVTESTPTQVYYGYQFPWPGNDKYKKGAYNWHEGASIDFLPDGHSAESAEIIATANGTITSICHNDTNDHAWLHVSTVDGTFKYLHLSWQSVNELGYQLNDKVEQGQKLGVLTSNTADGSSPCQMKSSTTHLHFTFPFKPFKIDAQYFGETDSEIPSSFPSTQCSARPKLNTASPPDWIISEGRDVNGQVYCSLKGDISDQIDGVNGLGNVTVDNNVFVTIDSSSDKCVNVQDCPPEDQSHRIDTRLNIDFSHYKLSVKEGSRVIIHKEAVVN